jgi:hypothetical protein
MMESRAEKMISFLSFGKDIRLIFTLNCVSLWRSHSDASKRDASATSLIALAVALPGVDESWVADAIARLRRASLAEMVGTKGH